MKINVKRFDKTLSLPRYEKNAAGFDFTCRTGVSIKPGEIVAVPANIAISVPTGYVLLAFSRSTTPTRKGLVMPHSVGVIDPFFCGDDNEIKLIFQNITKETVRIVKGDKLAQGVLMKIETAIFNEVDRLKKSTRQNCSYKS